MSDEKKRPLPNMFRDTDEFSRARLQKFTVDLLESVRRDIAGTSPPEPKDVVVPPVQVPRNEED